MADSFSLAGVRLFLLGLEGTLHSGGQLLPGAARFLRMLDELGIERMFLTNDSSRSRHEFSKQLAELGVAAPSADILTSGVAAIRYLRERQDDARVFLVGTPAMRDEFIRGHVHLVNTNPDFAVLGYDTTLTYKKLCELCSLVKTGVEFIATHPDLNCRGRDGYLPDIGGTLAYIKAVTNRDPDVIIGMPYRHMMDVVLADTGLAPSQIAVAGGRLSTDIEFGRRSGAVSVLLMSGETDERALAQSRVKPDFAFEDLEELAKQLEKLFQL